MFGYTVILPPFLCTSLRLCLRSDGCQHLHNTLRCKIFAQCTGSQNMACDGDKTRGTITKVPGVDIVEL